ncbi:MAG TPA: cytochrome c biogenesis protein ResB [Anaeromyxobacteraceae bacterium]|nr:cytochrome c biogenesis protein ResB [Anaeromyxobacteraceae bacterium]
MASPAAPPAPPARLDPVERAFALASDPRTAAALAAALGAAWAATRLLGPPEEAGGPLALLELWDPLHSWWFTLLLSLLALCALAFALDRVPRQVLAALRPARRLTGAVERGLRRVTRLPGSADAGAEAERVAAAFRARGYAPETAGEGATHHLFAERGRYVRFGEWAALCGLVTLLAAGVVGRFLEWDGTVELAEGSSAGEVVRPVAAGVTERQPLPFALRLNRLEVGGRRGSPASVSADLSVLGGAGGEVRRAVLQGTGSLRQEGLEVALGAWRELPGGALATLVLVDRETGVRRTVRVGRGEPIQVGAVSFAVEDYSPGSGDLGPAVRVRRSESGQSIDVWVFQQRPDLDARTRPDRWGLEFHGLRKGYAATLRVARRPVTGWLLGAAALAAAGLCAALSGTHRRLWARVEPGAVALAGSSHRPSAAFDRTLEAIGRDLGAPAGQGERWRPG